MAQQKCGKCGCTDFVREGDYDVCRYCGAKYPVEDPQEAKVSGADTAAASNDVIIETKSDKSWTLTLLLAIFFGYFGIHRFYVGKLCTGAIWFCTAGCFFVGWLGDIIKIAMGGFTDSSGRYISRK